MAEEQNQKTQIQYLLSDFATRLKDTEQRNSLVRERVLLLGKNLIQTKQQVEDEIQNLKKKTSQIEKEIRELKKTSQNIVEQIDKFVKRNEIYSVEKMLQDFQPLEFMRKKDVEELVNSRIRDFEKNLSAQTNKNKEIQ